MTIQEILAAQKKASDASRKARPAPVPTPAARSTVSEVLAAQRMAASRHKPAAPVSNPGQPNHTVAEIIERQRATAAAQQAERNARGIANENSAVISELKSRYQAFLNELEAELGDEQLVFVPNVPDNAEPVMVPAAENPAINGISVGSESGESVAIVMKPATKKRGSKKKREAVVEAVPATAAESGHEEIGTVPEETAVIEGED